MSGSLFGSSAPKSGGSALDQTSEIFEVLSEPTGFPFGSSGDSEPSFDDVSRQITLAPTGSSFNYYIQGREHTITLSLSLMISNDEGLHYIYLDDDELLKETMTITPSLFMTEAWVAVIYWDVSAAKHVYLASERHQTVMSGSTHMNLHFTQGTKWLSGLAFGNFVIDQASPASDAAGQFDCTSGQIADEDLDISIDDGDPQELTPILQAPVCYRTGAGDWNKDNATDFPVKRFGAVGTRLAWNELVGGVWQQTQVDNNDFVLCHIWATNDVENPIIAIQGQAEYNNQNQAREGATTEINNLVLFGLPFAEFAPLGSIIYQTSNGYTGSSYRARVRSTDEGDNYVDFRGFSIASMCTVADHGNLAGLSGDDHFQYGLLASRSGGQTLVGGSDASDDLTLSSTSNATKGSVNIAPDGEPVGIGTSTPSDDGALDIQSTDGALIVPRMTTTQRDGLTAENGMIIYNTTTNQFNFYENGAWVTK